MRYFCTAALALIWIWVGPAEAAWTQPQPQMLQPAAGVGLGILELRGLKAAWGLSGGEDVVRLPQGLVELSPPAPTGSGWGVRLSGGFGLLEGEKLLTFELSLLLGLPLRGARAYLGGGSGILSYRGQFYPTLHLMSGLKGEALGPLPLTIFMDVKLISVLDLSGSPPLLGAPLQLTPGVMLYLRF